MGEFYFIRFKPPNRLTEYNWECGFNQGFRGTEQYTLLGWLCYRHA